MTDGRTGGRSPDDAEQRGGFRWNLTPGGADDTPATPATSAVPKVEAAQAPESAPDPAPDPTPVDDWDVPTAASPVIGRSVFPLGPPSGTPALLPPPYVPSPFIQLTAAPPVDTALEGVTELLGAHPVGLPDPVDESPETSAIDTLFGASKFVDYDGTTHDGTTHDGTATASIAADLAMAPPPHDPPALVPPPVSPRTAASPTAALSSTALSPTALSSTALSSTALSSTAVSSAAVSSTAVSSAAVSSTALRPLSSLPFDTLPPLPASAVSLYEGTQTASPAALGAVTSRTMPRPQKILIGVAAALVAGLALVALFLFGMRIGQSTPAADVVASPSPKPSATPSVTPAAGPLAAGDYSWNELLGGECLTFYESPWQDRYTVIDCAEPHTGQLLSKSTLADGAGAPYPAPAQLQAAVADACAATSVIDYAAAGTIDDIQLEVSYPATAPLWDAGERTTFCFVTRAGGADLTGSLAATAT